MKKIISLLLVICCMATVCGCGSKSGMSKEEISKFGNREKTFTLCYFEGGFGSDWLKAVTEDYMLHVNKDVYISLKPSTDNETAREKISSQTGNYDLYRIEVDMFHKSDALCELTDLWDMDVPGEAGKKVKDKISADRLEFYNEDGKYYQMPATSYLGWNWTYNKTLLDKTLGEGNYQLPNTTDEFLAFGEKLFDKGVFLTAFAGNDTTGGADYLRYGYELWFAQMLGLDGYHHYFNCEYKTNGGYEIAKQSPENIVQNKNAIEKTYQLAQTLCQGQKGVEYMHAKSESLSFLDAQFLQYQGGYKGSKEYPIAFYYNYSTGEMEMASYIQDGIIQEQDVRAMKMPVISAIRDRLSTVNDDATLSAVVDYVDGNAASAPAGVSEEDIAAVKEARNMVVELVCREFVISKNAKNVDDIKNFLAYLTSDRAQKIAAQHCNGLPVLNYGYEPTEADMGYSFSEFTKSFINIAKSAVFVDYSKFGNPVGRAMGLDWYKDNTTSGGTLCKNLYSKQALSADKIYQSTLDSFTTNWKDKMEQYFSKKK